jgi:energy-coupling factor transporter ATP-binding protein EcfA2
VVNLVRLKVVSLSGICNKKPKKLKLRQFNNNRLPILAYNRSINGRLRLIDDPNVWDHREKYSYVKTNLLPYQPLKSNSVKVEYPSIVNFQNVEDIPNIQEVPYNVLEAFVKPKIAKVEKVNVSPINLDVPAIILPVEEEPNPAIIEKVQAEPWLIENPKIIQTEVAIPEVKESETELDLDYLFDKEVLDLQELLLLSKMNLSFLVEHLIPEGTITILAGPSDTGKSTLALQIATSIIQGKSEVIGKKITARHNKVIYISTEDGPNQVGKKLRMQLDPSSLELLGQQFRIVSTMDHLESELQNTKVDLVIIDTLPDFFKGEINSATAVRQFFNEEIKPKMKKYGFTTLILHHIGKNKSKVSHKDQLVGSQSIEAAARQVLYLVEGKRPQKVLKIVKGNYVSNEVKRSEIVLELSSERLLFTPVKNEPSETKPNTSNNLYSDLALIDTPPVRKRRNGPTKAKIEKALQLDFEGYTLEQMAKELGCKSPSTVRNWLIKEYGPNYTRKKE